MKSAICLFFVVYAVACTETGRNNVNTCVEGQTEACTCTNGSSGAQLCADGEFGVCECDGEEPAVDLADSEDQPADLRKPKVDMAKAGNTDLAVEQPVSDMAVQASVDMTGTPVADLKPPGSTDLAATTGKRVFVTNTEYAANAALNACQNSADAVLLGGTWVPWLSTSLVGAKNRITSNGPWKLLNGATAFNNAAQLATLPSVQINVNEHGVTLLTDGYVWTGTGNGGASSGNHCSSWTYTSGSLYYGTVGRYSSLADWTDETTATGCSGKYHVYCFEN